MLLESNAFTTKSYMKPKQLPALSGKQKRPSVINQFDHFGTGQNPNGTHTTSFVDSVVLDSGRFHLPYI